MSIYILHNNEQVPSPLIELYQFNHGNRYITKREQKPTVVVQWGVNQFSSETKSEWILNGQESINNSQPHVWRHILPLHGISVGQEPRGFSKNYILFVFQQKVIGIYGDQKDIWLATEMNSKQKYREVGVNHQSKEIKKLKELAIRTIYVLGLDFGMVRIGVKNNTYRVTELSPIPSLIPKVTQKLGEEIISFAKKVQEPIHSERILLGADPEFILRLQSGQFIIASRFFPRSGDVGCDRIWLRGDSTRSKLPIAELRPKPSHNPKELVTNLYRLLIKADNMIQHEGVQFLAGSTPLKGYPIGGHIHFSNVDINSFLLRALDNYLALPCMLIEDPKGLKRRPRYGHLGDYRLKPHGGFEYRVLPSWLISPRVTKGVIALAKVIVSSYPNLRSCPLSYGSVQEAFYGGEQEKLLQIVKYLWGELESQKLYAHYRSYLDPLKESIMSLQRWSETVDIRPRWKITRAKRIR